MSEGPFRQWIRTLLAPRDHESERPFDSSVALQRLALLGAGGCVVVLVYGLSPDHERFVTISVGLMTAGAAALAGILLGFIFGVPFTRDAATPQPKQESREGSSSKSPGLVGLPSSLYRPNTSLEQISDWLAKMLVGVGLVEIKTIPKKLTDLAHYISQGLGNGSAAETFALGVLTFFGVCGFLFGFLWARIYLRRWFTQADEDLVKTIDYKLAKIEADARALAIVTRQLSREPDDELLPDDELNEAIKQASPAVRAQIFEQASQASKNYDHPDHKTKVESVIPIFKALIASDTKKEYHRNHGELAYALGRKKHPDLRGATEALNEAINRRDKLAKTGWRYYEFRRAKFRIQQDERSRLQQPSEPALVGEIMKDLKAAYDGSGMEKWSRWLSEEKLVREWMERNKQII